MMQCGSEVPAIDGVRRPGVADRWFLMYEDLCAWRCKRCSVIVKGAMDLCIGREVGVDARASQEVQGDKGLRQQPVPKVQWEVFVSATETGNEVVLEGSDGSFGGIAAMEMRGGKLEVNLFFSHVVLESNGGFVV